MGTIKKNIIAIVLFLIFSFYFANKYVFVIKREVNLNNINKLMIVAHPDDELLWGGRELINNDYLVLCITCGKNIIRNYEFINVLDKTKDKYYLLGYSDRKNKKTKWASLYNDIEKDIRDIINLKDWDIILTHNPEGEYGHLHHLIVNKIVTNNVKNKEKLYYFGKYYSKRKIRKHFDELVEIESNILKQKNMLIGKYGSQKFIQYKFGHMIPYERLIKYTEWR